MLNSSTCQTYSDLKDSLSMSSLHSSESLGSVTIPLTFDSKFSTSNEPLSSITDLDETIKSPISTTKSSIQPRQLHVAREVIERYDEGVFDDGGTSQNEDDETNSVIINDSDEDEIEHFDSTDSITIASDPTTTITTRLNNRTETCLDNSTNHSMEGQSMSLGKNKKEFFSLLNFSNISISF